MMANRLARTLVLAALAALAAVAPAAAITIVAPAAGVTVSPGATLLVTVAPSASDGTITAVTAGMSMDALVDGTASATVSGGFDAQITVPQDAVGPSFVIAVAALANGNTALDFVPVTVDPGPLRALSVVAPGSMTVIGQVTPLAVHGLFEDGVVRDLTLAERGSIYTSSNEAVLGIEGNGLVQARTTGTAQVTVTNRGQTATAVVHVSLPDPATNHIPVANPGADQTVAPVTVVTLSGTGSSDPDGDPLTYQWEQLGGRIVTLVGDTTAQPTFIAPRVTAQEVLTFTLVVSDNKGATTFPAIVHVTVNP